MEAYKLGVSKKQDTMLVGVGFPEEAGTHQREQLQELELPGAVLSGALNLEKESSDHLK